MKKLLLVAFAILIHITGQSQSTVQNLTTENMINPIGIDVAQPRFSWQLSSSRRNTMQTSYELLVSKDKDMKGTVWSPGKISSDQSIHVIYNGEGLKPMQRYFWQVRVWDNSGKASAWSATSYWETGLLNSPAWVAQWIVSNLPDDKVGGPAPMLRKEFSLAKTVASARVYVTAHGLYEGWINGQRIGDAYLTPGWTSYTKRLQYQPYDVTSALKSGNNAIGVQLGDGWYRGHLGWEDSKNLYGKDLALIFQLNIRYSDGTEETVVSDGSWKSSTGPIRSSEIYHGEVYDARMEKSGWTSPGYSENGWQSVKIADFETINIIASVSPSIKKRETFKAIKLIKTPKGENVIDFGQNLVGWVQMKVKGNAGDVIRVQHAEVLDKLGNFYIDNMRSAKTEFQYTLKGGAEETYESSLTFYGFRYIKIVGYPGELSLQNFLAYVLYSDIRPTGTFECSNPLVNQLQHNIQWGQKGNFLDVPTDCPQRDERMGWTGDAQAFFRTASFNMDVEQFFAKWLRDVSADQLSDGAVPWVVPNVLGELAVASAGWSDASTIIPWNMYVAYGDRRVLETQYESMKAWVGCMEKRSKNYLWNTGFHFGDWLFYRPHDDNDGNSAVTDKYLIAQCFFAHSTQLVVNAAKVLGRFDDITRYEALLKNVKDAFLKEYVTPNGKLVSGTQTAYSMALNFDMLPEAIRPQTAQLLVDNIRKYNNHLTTGFIGAPYLPHVLTRFGHTDVAYTLLMQETYPSYLYPVKMGATTIWERWDGIKPDSTFQVPTMNSFNHYAYGAIGDWMYRSIAGIDTQEDGVGYRHIKIQPRPGAPLTYAKADYQTKYGRVYSSWKSEQGKLNMDVEIPANTYADLYIPGTAADKVTEGGKPLKQSKDIFMAEPSNGYVHIKVGSGTYHFTVSN